MSTPAGNMNPSQRREGAFEREPARRVFAGEFRDIRVQFKDSADEKSPTFVLLPTGERCNRVLAIGTLTEKQKQGDQNIFYRGRIVDPTGTFFVMAGSYQPEAMQQLARVEPPQFVAAIGKPSVYQTPDGSFLVSLRLESITIVDKETRDEWVLDTAAHTLDRLDALGKTPDSLKAIEEYKTNPDVYRKMVYDALTQIRI